MEANEEVQLTDKEKFDRFVAIMVKNGFRVVSPREKYEHRAVERLTPPKHRRPRPGQILLEYEHKPTGMKTLVWSTFAPSIGKLIEQGDAMGWVIITSPKADKSMDEEDYFHPVKRVGAYWNTLLNMAIAAKQRVEHRPQCKQCSEFMDIARKHGVLKARFWRCATHRKEREGWDHGVSAHRLVIPLARRKMRKAYRDKRKKEGKPLHTAMLSRIPWSQGVQPQGLED